MYHFSVKPPCAAEVILRGAAEEYLSQIHLCQGKVVLQLILRPPGSIWTAGDGIWIVGGGIWREEQISDNLDFKPENYLWVFEVGRSIIILIG